jgi:hypothetical protein
MDHQDQLTHFLRQAECAATEEDFFAAEAEISAARGLSVSGGGKISIHDDARASRADGGIWVEAWFWLSQSAASAGGAIPDLGGVSAPVATGTLPADGEDFRGRQLASFRRRVACVAATSEFFATADEVDRARAEYGCDDREVDAEALVSRADGGFWVQGWVWLDTEAEEDGQSESLVA